MPTITRQLMPGPLPDNVSAVCNANYTQSMQLASQAIKNANPSGMPAPIILVGVSKPGDALLATTLIMPPRACVAATSPPARTRPTCSLTVATQHMSAPLLHGGPSHIFQLTMLRSRQCSALVRSG